MRHYLNDGSADAPKLRVYLNLDNLADLHPGTVWPGLQRNECMADGNGAGALRVSEVDVALLLQAKAAIGAGIEILLETAGIRAADLGRVYLAGGFGMHLNVAHAIAIGLLPGFCEEQVRVVGNTSLALVDRTTLIEMENLRSQMEVIELNLAPDFEDRYVEHLMLP